MYSHDLPLCLKEATYTTVDVCSLKKLDHPKVLYNTKPCMVVYVSHTYVYGYWDLYVHCLLGGSSQWQCIDGLNV